MQNSVQKSKIYWITVFTFILLSLTFSFFIHHHYSQALSLGLTIPDVSALADSLHELHKNGISGRYDLYGLYVIYTAGHSISPWLYPITNIILFILFTYFYKKIFINFSGNNQSFFVALLGVICNPLILLNMPGPNKEIPLLAITITLCWTITEKPPYWIISSIILALFSAAFRDGFGAILLCFTFIYIISFSIQLSTKHLIGIIFLICGLISIMIEPLSQWFYFLHRNINIAHHISNQNNMITPLLLDISHYINIWMHWIKRIVLNITSLAFFPVIFQTNEKLHWAGLSYWLFGIGNLFAFLSCSYILLTSEKTHKNMRLLTISAFWISICLMLSVSLYVQPRYMIVTMPLGIGLLSYLTLKVRIYLSITIGVIIIITIGSYYLTQGKFPVTTPDTYPINPYNLQ